MFRDYFASLKGCGSFLAFTAFYGWRGRAGREFFGKKPMSGPVDLAGIDKITFIVFEGRENDLR